MGSGSARAMALMATGALSTAAMVLTGPAATAIGRAANATIEVWTVDDVVDAGDGVTSLREAFAQASADEGDDVIVLRARPPEGGRYEARSCDPGLGDFDHTDPTGALTLDGNGFRVAVPCGERAIESTGTGRLTLQHLRIEDSGPELPNQGPGGAVRAAGDIYGTYLQVMRNHTSKGAGGGLASPGEVDLTASWIRENHADGSGGGISAATVDLHGSRIEQNTAINGGGVAAGTALANGTTFEANSAGGNLGSHHCCGHGGGVLASGSAVLNGVTVHNNHANGHGAGVAAAQVTARDSSFLTNVADHGGGAIYADGRARVVRTSLQRNVAGSAVGGGVFADRAEIVASSAVGNEAVDGGGVATWHDVAVVDSTLSSNRAYGRTGTEGRGGAAFTFGGRLSLLRSTVVSNEAGRGANLRAGGSVVARASVIGQAVRGASCWGPGRVTSHGYNVTDTSGACGLGRGTGDRIGLADLGLRALDGDGHRTKAHVPTGRTLSVIPAAACSGTPDQWGQQRPQGPRCEAGSVEIG